MPQGPLLPLVISYNGDTDCDDFTWVDFIYLFVFGTFCNYPLLFSLCSW